MPDKSVSISWRYSIDVADSLRHQGNPYSIYSEWPSEAIAIMITADRDAHPIQPSVHIPQKISLKRLIMAESIKSSRR
jgi:hypothetical protein